MRPTCTSGKMNIIGMGHIIARILLIYFHGRCLQNNDFEFILIRGWDLLTSSIENAGNIPNDLCFGPIKFNRRNK